MAIRSAVKTIVVNKGRILLIKYVSESDFVHYELPGGGQEQFEALEETARREFFEETGYQINIDRFVALAEEIFLDKEIRENYPNYAHRILHIFQGEIISEDLTIEKEIVYDKNQVGCEWIPIEKVSDVYLIPKPVKDRLSEIINSKSPIYLGTSYEAINLS